MTGPSLEIIKGQYDRLYTSTADIGHALYCAEILTKNDWQHLPDGRSQVASQVAYTTAMIVSYCRPFTESEGWPGFPERLLRMSYDAEERNLHHALLCFRNSLYAHTDSGWYTITHVISPDGKRSVRSTSSGYLIHIADVARFEKMAAKLQENIATKMAELESQIPPETAEAIARRFLP